MKDKKNIIIICLSVVAVALTISLYVKSKPVIMDSYLVEYNFRGNSVPNKQAAIDIAKIIYKVRTGIGYSDEDFEVSDKYDENAWNVKLINEYENNKTLYHFGYSGIYIDKNYGTILRDYIR